MHHEQYPKFQSDFKANVNSLVDAFEQLGNPFLEDSGEMLDLDQSLIIPFEVVKKYARSRRNREAAIYIILT